jgi:hypothetical protein
MQGISKRVAIPTLRTFTVVFVEGHLDPVFSARLFHNFVASASVLACGPVQPQVQRLA